MFNVSANKLAIFENIEETKTPFDTFQVPIWIWSHDNDYDQIL